MNKSHVTSSSIFMDTVFKTVGKSVTLIIVDIKTEVTNLILRNLVPTAEKEDLLILSTFLFWKHDIVYNLRVL